MAGIRWLQNSGVLLNRDAVGCACEEEQGLTKKPSDISSPGQAISLHPTVLMVFHHFSSVVEAQYSCYRYTVLTVIERFY